MLKHMLVTRGTYPDATLPRPREDTWFQLGLVTAALGAGPGAVAGSEDRVASAAFRIINQSAIDGHLSVSQIILAAFLKYAAGRARKDRDGIFRQVVADAYYSLSVRAGTLFSREAEMQRGFFALDASQALLSVAVLRAPPLSGERVRCSTRVAERYLARAKEEGDAATAASLGLLLAFLAARDGHFNEVLQRYAEVARDDPSDPWPHFLARALCLFMGAPAEAKKWEASFQRLHPEPTEEEQVAMFTLADELVVALALGGSPVAFNQGFPNLARRVVESAANMVDASLVSALQDKERSVVARLEVRAVRAFLRAWTWVKLKEFSGKNCGSGAAKE